MTVQDDIIRFLKITGPTIPSKVAKHIKTEILFASAHLSDLSSQKKVKISSLKVGGTPLYYLPGQEDQLYHFAAGNLNPKDYQVLERLKSEKLLRESDLDLLTKVALRGLKDFAIPLNVTTPERTELFWRYYLVPSEETNELIGKTLKQDLPIPEIISNIVPPDQNIINIPTEIDQSNPSSQPSPSSPSSVSSAARFQTISQQTLTSEPSLSSQTTTLPTSLVTETITKKRGRPKTEKTSPTILDQKEIDQTLSSTPPLPTILPPPQQAPSNPKKSIDTEFGFLMDQHFQKLNIETLEAETIRKNELNYILKVPSAVGHIKYAAKAKQKARIDEGDLAAAYLEAQLKKLPLLYLYTGELTKKAEEMIAKGAYENMTLKKMG